MRPPASAEKIYGLQSLKLVADYEYLKRRLREDVYYTFYFIIRFITATRVPCQ